jgi:hypothetical protein
MKFELLYSREHRIQVDAENIAEALSMAEKKKPANYQFQDYKKILTVSDLEESTQKIKSQPLP